MKTFIIVGSGVITPGVKWTCKANTEEEAWESLSKIKVLPITELKKMYKVLNGNQSKNQ